MGHPSHELQRIAEGLKDYPPIELTLCPIAAFGLLVQLLTAEAVPKNHVAVQPSMERLAAVLKEGISADAVRLAEEIGAAAQARLTCDRRQLLQIAQADERN